MIKDEEAMHMKLEHGTYIGPNRADKGKTALIKVFEDCVEVQFDEFEHPMSHGWHTFPKSNWEILPEVDFAGGTSVRVG